MEYQHYLKQPEIVAPVRKPLRESKFWIRAGRRENNQHLSLTNHCTEFAYHKLLKLVKKLLAPQQAYIFEKNCKQDRTNLFTMHEFQCETLFLNLWCCASEYYFVDYDFHNCPFEEQIRHFLDHEIRSQGRHFPVHPGFFERAKQREDASFFYQLKVETDQEGN